MRRSNGNKKAEKDKQSCGHGGGYAAGFGNGTGTGGGWGTSCGSGTLAGTGDGGGISKDDDAAALDCGDGFTWPAYSIVDSKQKLKATRRARQRQRKQN